MKRLTSLSTATRLLTMQKAATVRSGATEVRRISTMASVVYDLVADRSAAFVRCIRCIEYCQRLFFIVIYISVLKF